MAKRSKRIEKGKESLIEQIERHFEKIEKDIEEGNLNRGKYHANEIDKSLLTALEEKLRILKESNELVEKYRLRLKKIKEIMEKII